MINTPLFETKNCLLTEIDYETDPERDSLLSQDLRYARYLNRAIPKPLSKSEIKKIYEKLEKSVEDGSSTIHFAIRERKNPQLVGFARFNWILWNHAVAAITIAIGEPSCRGKIEAELIAHLLNYAFRELNLYRVDCYISQYESELEKALIQNGFSCDVTLKEADFFNNQYWNQLIYGITHDDWKNGAEIHVG